METFPSSTPHDDPNSVFTLDLASLPIDPDAAILDNETQSKQPKDSVRQPRYHMPNMKYSPRAKPFRRNFWKADPQRVLQVRQAMQHTRAASLTCARRSIPFVGISFDRERYQLVKAHHLRNRPSGYRIPLDLCVEPPEQALTTAFKEVNEGQPQHSRDENRLILWTDATQTFVPKPATGFSVVYRASTHSPDWTTRGYCVQEKPGILQIEAEMLAIAQALHIAYERVLALIPPSGPKLGLVNVYTKAQRAIMRLHSYNQEGCVENAPLREAIFYLIALKTEQLQERGIRTCIKWVPAHSHVPGNKLAMRISLQARREAYSRRRRKVIDGDLLLPGYVNGNGTGNGTGNRYRQGAGCGTRQASSKSTEHTSGHIGMEQEESQHGRFMPAASPPGSLHSSQHAGEPCLPASQ